MKLPNHAAIAFACIAFIGAPGLARDRVRTVAGWRVADRSEQDGGRLVTLAKSGRGWNLEHHFALWHGNGGVYVGANFRWHGCVSGEADYKFEWDEAITTEILAQRTRDYLDECGLTPSQQKQLLAGLGEANAQVQRWISDFRKTIEADEQ